MKQRNNIAAFLVGLFLLVFAPCAAEAATYYVAMNGNDSSDGSESSPFRTIAHAVNRMVAGDTTFVKGGVYSKAPGFYRSGTVSAPIKLFNAPGESPVIDCGRVGTDHLSISSRNGIGHITVEGFEIRNCHHGIALHNGYNITIRRNWIRDNKAQGINGNGKNVLIDRNVISHNGSFAACAAGALFTNGGSTTHGTICNKHHGIYATGPNFVITNNLIYDNLAYGVQVAGYEHCPGKVCPSGSTTYTKEYPDVSWSGADGWIIANNTIAYNHYRSAIGLWQSRTTNSKIINNIFYENSQKYADNNGVSIIGSGGGHEIRNNLCYATSPGSTKCIENEPGKYVASGNVENTVLPGFVSAGPAISGVPDFKLQPGSPAIDKGESLSQVTWDHQGIKRPAGASFDIGAYEFCPPSVVCEQGSPPPNPVGDGVPPAVARPPSTYDPTRSLCPI